MVSYDKTVSLAKSFISNCLQFRDIVCGASVLEYVDSIGCEKLRKRCEVGRMPASLYLGAFEVSWHHLRDCLRCRNCIAVVLLSRCLCISSILCLYGAFRLLKMCKVFRVWNDVLTLWTPWSQLHRWLLCNWNITYFVHLSGAVFTS